MSLPKKLLVVQVAALGYDLVRDLGEFHSARAVFPGLTSVFQASFRTATLPGSHGLVANGLYFPELTKVLFWEQSAALVEGARIWAGFRARGGTVGMMFWQQSMGEAVDLIVTPAPIHKHSGGMIQSCYTQPKRLEAHLTEKVGRRFNLMNYWGPLANRRSSDWIVDATVAVMGSPEFAPDLLCTYLPHLDYDLQRYGPASAKGRQALEVFLGYFSRLKAACADFGYDWLVLGDYAIEPVRHGAIFPNRALRDAGLFVTREIAGMDYTDFFTSRAFAVVDHQIAQIHCRDTNSASAAREVLLGTEGVAEVLDRDAQAARSLAHRRGGELLAIAQTGAWFAYPWFEKKRAPDYASHVDIHNKPGYDPCELFFGWPPGSVSFDTAKIHGTHGNIGPGLEVAWSSSLEFREEPQDVLGLASEVKTWMERPR